MKTKSFQNVLQKRTLEKKLLRLFSDQVDFIQKQADQKGLAFNDALRQILDIAMGTAYDQTRNR